MAQSKEGFTEFLAGEVRKYKGIYIPVRSGLARRLLLRRLPCKKIHPNPDDDFCKPEIGPNFRIISEYREKFRQEKRMGSYVREPMEPLIVERIRPDGYILLNGHHRWAAALMSGKSRLPVSVTNLTQKMDVQRMLWNSKHHKRAVLDLDEVVFAAEGDPLSEKALPYPLRLRYTHRLRLGIPGLFHFLNVQGYDIWVYSRSCYSLDYIRALFRLHKVFVTGIVTGTAQKRQDGPEGTESIEKLITSRYDVTLSIDANALWHVDHRIKKYNVCQLKGDPAGWSAEVMEKTGSLDKDEQSAT